ncbi:MAG: type II toxin-antitoxin system prevent-host-death family antitoxin [Cryobacterium sp.]|nr:type II toxin-antitoxin system prevent-host-death family antitoxin [Cryobacterium sp.]
MDTFTLTEARAQLPLLLNRVENGEELTITRHGRPVAVVVGHAQWMKTARYEVLEEARSLRKRLDALRERPITAESFPVVPGYDADAHIAEIRESDDPWERVERERGGS